MCVHVRGYSWPSQLSRLPGSPSNSSMQLLTATAPCKCFAATPFIRKHCRSSKSPEVFPQNLMCPMAARLPELHDDALHVSAGPWPPKGRPKAVPVQPQHAGIALAAAVHEACWKEQVRRASSEELATSSALKGNEKALSSKGSAAAVGNKP